MVQWKNASAIKIDWKTAVNEAEKAFEKMQNLEMAQVLCKVKLAYNKDDVSGYLEILDKYRKELKQS